MAGLGGMNVGNAFGGVPQNAGTTQQGSTLQSLPGMGTSTAQQTQQSAAQTPSTLGYAPQQNAQNVFGYNMGRLASAMDPSATLPFYNQYASPYYPQAQQNINPYQGVTDILGSLGSFFNESIAPTFQSAYDQQFQNFQNQLNDMSQRFAAPPPAAPSYTSELDALRQQIAQLQGQIANPVIPTPAPTPAPIPAPAAAPTPTPAPTPASSLTIAQAREQLNRGSGLSAREAANILGVPVVNTSGVTRTPISSTARVPTPAPVPAPAATPSQVAQQFAIPASQNIAPSPAVTSDLIRASSAPTPAPAPSSIFSLSPFRMAGGGEIEAFNPAMNSGTQSNLMSSAERVYDLGPGYRELGVVPGNIAGGTAGPNVPYVAPPGLTPPPVASTTVAPIKYSQALSEYQKLGLGQQGIFGLATTPQQLADALKKPVIQKGKTYTPKITGAAYGGMVHGGMTNRLKHMLK